jgi:hypothetical protein
MAPQQNGFLARDLFSHEGRKLRRAPESNVCTGTIRRCGYALSLALLACSSGTPDDAVPGGGTGGAVSTGAGGGTGGSAVAGTGGAISSGGTGGSVPATGGATSAGGTGGSSAGQAGNAGSPGTGGSSSGTGGVMMAGTGGDGTAGSGMAGQGTAGDGSAGQGTGGGTAGQGPVEFGEPEGTIPNEAQPPTSTNLPKEDWEDGILSPSMQNGHQINQSAAVNGYLLIGGNEEFWLYDVSNPAQPKQLSEMRTPNRTGGEAETHAISFARYGNKFYMVTIGGRGIDTWDVTSATEPKHLDQLQIPGTSYGDYTEAVWGVAWQGQYIYVGATNNGIKVVDAADPTALAIAGEVPTSQYGGVSAGPVEAVGNVLVVMTPKESGGVATLDISDPVKPTRLASFTTDTAYIGAFHRRHVYLIGVRAWDVLTNPSSIGSGSSPIGRLATEGAEYMAFSDDRMFLGHLRTEISGTPGASKIDVTDPRNMRVVNRVWGRLNLGNLNDDQFVFPFGNLLVIGDDQAPYPGWVIAVHQAEADTKAPVIDTVIPKDQATAVSVKSRIGVTFSDNIELATVNAASFIVRPVGGQPLTGKWGLRMGVVNFDPDQDLQPATTYEVVLPAGGVGDLVGNRLATEWKTTFTTK